jgi:hypothetical protein
VCEDRRGQRQADQKPQRGGGCQVAEGEARQAALPAASLAGLVTHHLDSLRLPQLTRRCQVAMSIRITTAKVAISMTSRMRSPTPPVLASQATVSLGKTFSPLMVFREI